MTSPLDTESDQARTRSTNIGGISRVIASLLLVAAIVAGSAAPAHAVTSDEHYVDRLYQDFLGRAPDSNELLWGTVVLANYPRSAYVDSLLVGTEFRSRWITGAFQRYLIANPTSSELSTALTALNSSGDYLDTELDVLEGSAYFTLSAGTNSDFVTALYNDLLWREPDSGGLTYWTGKLDTLTKTRRQVATSLIRGNESASLRVKGLSSQTTCTSTDLTNSDDLASGSYCLVLDRMADTTGATYWTAQLTGSGQLPTLWSSHASSTEYYNLAQP